MRVQDKFEELDLDVLMSYMMKKLQMNDWNYQRM